MKEKMILLIIIFNVIIIFAEIFFGLISNSFALIADALHNTGDVIAIIITYIALKLGTKKSTFKYTFGFIKSEMMAAFVNTLFLSLTMFYMIYEAINRFFNPEIIEPMYMIVVGIIAVIANSISAYILHRLGIETHEHSHEDEHNHHHEEDANIRSAYLHMLSDALISVGVVVAGIFIYYFKVYYIDSILTIVFSIYILNHSFPLLKKSFLSLMDANSVDISKDELNAIIKSNEAVVEYHDLHISKPSSKYSFISFHIVLNNDMLSLKDIEEITENIRYKLKENRFSHIIIQVDSSSCIRNNINCIEC